MTGMVLETGEMGVTLGSGCEWFPEGTRLRMLRDRVLLRVLDWQPSRWIKVETVGMRPVRGVAVSVGPGSYRKRYYRNLSGEIDRVGEISMNVCPCDVQVGDTVEIGGLELRGYSFVQVMIGHELHVVIQEADICVVDEDPLKVEFGDRVINPERDRLARQYDAMTLHDRNMERTRVHKPSLKNFKVSKASHGSRSR